MARTRIPFATNSYRSRSLPVSGQRLVNIFPEVQPDDAKGKLVLFGSPGLTRFATAGIGPVRGLHIAKEVLYAVSGSSLYRIDAAGIATQLGPVTAGGAQVAIADIGTQIIIAGGGSADVWDGTAVLPIADEDFPGAVAVATLDGFAIFVEPNSGRFGVSAINDLTAYDALDYATAESAPDDLLTLIVDHREVWLVGSRSIEIWTDTGAADFPLERLQGANIERGTAAAGSVAKCDGSVFLLGDDRLVYRVEGYIPKRISHHAIEAAISSYPVVSDAESLVYAQGGHTFYALTFPSAPDGGATWVFDAATGFWHERQSGLAGRWLGRGAAQVYGKVLIGDSQSGAIFALDPDASSDDGAALIRSATSAPMHAQGRRAIAHRIELDFDMGHGLTPGQGSDPQAMLQWSDDGGRSWSPERWASMGAVGEYRRRAVWTRCGSFRERVWRVTVSDPVPFVLLAANIDVEGLAS